MIYWFNGVRREWVSNIFSDESILICAGETFPSKKLHRRTSYRTKLISSPSRPGLRFSRNKVRTRAYSLPLERYLDGSHPPPQDEWTLKWIYFTPLTIRSSNYRLLHLSLFPPPNFFSILSLSQVAFPNTTTRGSILEQVPLSFEIVGALNFDNSKWSLIFTCTYF